jgi:hypothetical protein
LADRVAPGDAAAAAGQPDAIARDAAGPLSSYRNLLLGAG